MSKWGSIHINGAEKIICPQIVPVPLYLDRRKLRPYFLWKLIKFVFFLPLKIWRDFVFLRDYLHTPSYQRDRKMDKGLDNNILVWFMFIFIVVALAVFAFLIMALIVLLLFHLAVFLSKLF